MCMYYILSMYVWMHVCVYIIIMYVCNTWSFNRQFNSWWIRGDVTYIVHTDIIIYTYIHVHTYMHTYYINTCIHTYLHTYIHTYIHTCTYLYINIKFIILCSDIYIYVPLALRTQIISSSTASVISGYQLPNYVLYITNNMYYLISISFILSVRDICRLKAWDPREHSTWGWNALNLNIIPEYEGYDVIRSLFGVITIITVWRQGH